MKLTEMDLKKAQGLMNWWVETDNTRVDEMKNPDVLYNFMFNDPAHPPFYTLPGLLFIVTNIKPGMTAVLYELGILGDEYDPKEAKRELINIAKEYELKRLTFACPSSVNAFRAKLPPLGLNYEGRMRFAAMYNGKISDIDLYGFYTIKPKGRKRRGRRKEKAPASQAPNRIENGSDSPGAESV